MKFNKTVIKSLVFSTALASLPFLGLNSVKADSPAAAPQLTFDGAKATVTANGSNNFWGVAKVTKAPKKRGPKHTQIGGKWYQINNIESMVGNEVDLSKYKGKAVFVAVGAVAEIDEANQAKWTILEVPAGVKKFKAFYSADQAKAGKVATESAKTKGGEDVGYLSFFNDKTQMAVADVASNVEVKVGNGDWQSAINYLGADLGDTAKKLGVLTQRGAKLTFRIKGSATAWGSNEAKVSVAGKKKGPSVKLDIVKGTSNVKKNVEFKTVKEGEAIPESGFGDAKEKAAISDLGIVNDGEAEGLKTQIIYLRDKKVGSKMSSKLSRLVVKKIAKPEIKTEAADITAQGEEIIKNAVSIKLNVDYDLNKGAEVINVSQDTDYEIAVSHDGTDKDLKWIKLNKAKDTDRPTRVKIKASSSKKPNTFNPVSTPTASKIFVRKPGVKQAGEEVTLPSAPISANLKFEKIQQVVSVTTQTLSYVTIKVKDTDGTIAFKLPKETEKNFEIAAKITNITKRTGKPKFKVNGAPSGGVKVTVSEFAESGEKDVTFTFNIAVTEKTFKTAPSGSMTVEFEHETAKKKYTISFAPVS